MRAHAGHPLRTDSGTVSNALPSAVTLSDGVTEDEAVALALWNNPLLQENLSKLGLARGDLAQAGLLSNPTFSILFPLGPKQLEFAATFPLEALWLRPQRVAIARLDAERIADGLVQNGLDLARDVRNAMSDLGLARDRARFARETLAIRERIARITEDRQRGGEASELETLAVRLEIDRAREEAHRADTDAAVAEQRLLALLGMNHAQAKITFPPPEPPPTLEPPLDDLERRAAAARPDVRATELAVEAAAKRAGLARAEIFTLSGIIDANGDGDKGFEIGPGAQLPVPIFNQNQAGRSRAAAEVERAAWNAIGVRQRVTLEVREAHLHHQHALEALRAWTTQTLPAFEDLVHRSEAAVGLGEMSPLILLENTRLLLSARLHHAELTAELRRAWSEMERSVGTRLSPLAN